ncbi:MAG: site-specific integrase [Alphaproteobacteria bacterium]|nr:site-specific integrase [Alphaproteobacteria bacterium]
MGSVRKRGKTWNAQVRVSGWRSFTKSFKSKSDALCWIKALENNLKSTDIPKVNIGNITLKDLLQRYATEMSLHLIGSEVQIYVLNFYARHPIAQIKLSDLTERHFEYLRDERLKQVKHGTVHAQFMLLKRVFRTATFKWGYGIPKNPIEQLQLPPTHKSRKRRLVGNEKERLLYAACSQKNIYIAYIIEFAIETGMRRSEILKLRWHDIDFTNGFAFLYDTKNGEDRKVPLTKRCMKLLQKVPQSHEKVFPITANCLRLAWGRARAKAEIKDLRFHDLRHEAVSRFFEMGMSVPEVALISGHKDVRQLLRYTHLNPTNIFKKYEEF